MKNNWKIFKKTFRELSLFWPSFFFLFFLALFLVFYSFKLSWFSFLFLAILFIFLFLVFRQVFSLIKRYFILSKERNYILSIVEGLLDAVIAYDEDFVVTVFNSSAEKMFSLSRKEVIGKVIKPSLIREPSWQLLVQVVFPSLAPAIKNRVKGKFREEFDLVFKEPEREFHISSGRLLDAKGKIIGFVKVIHDSTRERQLLKEKTEFLDIAAHNLNTPATEIRWGIETLSQILQERKDLSQEVSSLISKLKRAISNLIEIVDEILSAAKIEEGRFGYNFQLGDIEELIEERLKKWLDIAQKHSLKVYFSKSKDRLPKVFFDKFRIGLVIDNLLENAILYNVKNGEVEVKVKKDPQRPYLIVSVRDTGIGISEKEREKVFAKFFRSEKAKKHQVEGIGLGLYICRNIIRRHGGKIWFKSVENRGSTFYFSLPVKKELIPPKEVPLI